MAKPASFAEVEMDVDPESRPLTAVPEPDTPFRILILGDFSGRANRGLSEQGLKGAKSRPVLVDRDNFDEVMAKLGAELRLPPSSQDPLVFKFRELDDFHPDQIYRRTDAFQALRQTREKLADPSTFKEIAARLRGVAKEKAAAASEPARLPTPASEQRPHVLDPGGLGSGSVLDDIVGATESHPEAARGSGRPDELTQWISQIVAPHLVPKADPAQSELTAQLDQATSDYMGAILHHPDFQRLEAAWRAVFFLVRGLETGVNLKLYLLDVSKAELAADLASGKDLRATGTYKLLVEQTVGAPGGQPWAAVAADYTFGPGREDAELLGRIARIAPQAGAPFVAAAHPRLVGCQSLADAPEPFHWTQSLDAKGAEAWEQLRGAPEASYIGLALPRFLLRLPYGKETDHTDEFNFEEMPTTPSHEDYLWANPAFACVYLLAQAFSEAGWELRAGAVQDISGLPLHAYKEDGESRLKPCAETLLTEDAAEAIMDRGPMPLVSLKDTDTVRLLRFQSIRKPATRLAGRWSA